MVNVGYHATNRSCGTNLWVLHLDKDEGNAQLSFTMTRI